MDPNSFPTSYIDDAGIIRRLPYPSRPLEYETKSNDLIVRFDSGHEQRRKKGSSLLVVKLKYKALPAAAARVIRDFFIDCGTTKAFDWTDPTDGTTYRMRFDGSYAWTNTEHNNKGPIFSVSCSLQQVLL